MLMLALKIKQIIINNQIRANQQNKMQKSKKLSTFQKSKKFFKDNTIKVGSISQIRSYSSHQLTNNHNTQSSYYKSNQQSEQRNRPLSNSRTQLQFYKTNASESKTSRLNPKQFTHRQVFNSKLYQTVTGTNQNSQFTSTLGNNKQMKKYFQISISKKQRQQANLGDELGQYFNKISQILTDNNYHESQSLKKQWKTINHYVHQLQKKTCKIPNNQPIKSILTNTMNSIEQFIIKLSDLTDRLQKYQKQQEINLTNLKRKKQIISQQQLIQLQKQTKLQQQHNQSIILSKQKAKISQLDFQLKKTVLKVQARDQQLQNCKIQISRLIQQNISMKKEKQGIQKWKQQYQYRIRKLKEELEVAHIVKQQNLQDKYNYILGWTL